MTSTARRTGWMAAVFIFGFAADRHVAAVGLDGVEAACGVCTCHD